MISLTIKYIPDELHRLIKERARDNGRSLNAEVISCLRQSVTAERVDVDELIARAGRLREQAALHLTDPDVERLRREGLS